MTDYMYYDTFEDVYCLKKQDEGIDPPERYLTTYRGDDIVIEHWVVDNGKRIDIAYTKEEYKSGRTILNRRKAMEEEHGCRLRQIISWVIPKDRFDELFKEYCDD